MPQNKAKESLTFYDYQHAFYEYWAPYQVDRGYYSENGIKIKARGWKQFKRWEYEMETRINLLYLKPALIRISDFLSTTEKAYQ